MTMMTSRLTRRSFGFYLTRAAQRWRAMLYERFCAAGYPEMRPTYGAVLVPLFEEDGLRLGALARRSGLSKQTMTTLIRQIEDIGMIERRRPVRSPRHPGLSDRQGAPLSRCRRTGAGRSRRDGA